MRPHRTFHPASARFRVTTRPLGLKLCEVPPQEIVGLRVGAIGTVALACVMCACTSKLVIADFTCGPPDSSASGAVASDGGKAFDFPWTYGFENGFCDYDSAGYCFNRPPATRTIVDWPVHSGKYAAAFTIIGGTNGNQSRCFREGSLPQEAYYGAWYFVPNVPRTSRNWNLFFFQGGDGPNLNLQGVWDVSLADDGNGGLQLYIFEHTGQDSGIRHDVTTVMPIPIGEWFHIQFFMRRAADATGEIDLYQDGTNILQLSNIVTFTTKWGQWYVGNLANALDPAESTVYVDDISVESTL